jgi:hypothetical protein
MACYRNGNSAGAVGLATRLAAALGTSLTLVSAYDFEPVAVAAGRRTTSFNDVRLDAAQAQLGHALELVPDGLSLCAEVVPAEGTAAALVAAAHEADACLLVVGRDVDGHVTKDLLARTPCPLAVAPQDDAGAPLSALGVGWDGSPGARFALRAAVHLAQLAQARIEVLATAGGAEAAAAGAEAIARVRVVPVRGDLARHVVEASAGLDLVLIGPHRAAHVIDDARCPVVVVPPRARSRQATPLGLTTAGEA